MEKHEIPYNNFRINFIILSKKQVLFTYCNAGAIFTICFAKLCEWPGLRLDTCGLRSPILYNVLSVFISDNCFNIYLCEVRVFIYIYIWHLITFLEFSGNPINSIINIVYRRRCNVLLEVECDPQVPENC